MACSGATSRIAKWMRRITSTPSSVSTSPVIHFSHELPVARIDVTRIQRASEGAEHSTSGRGDQVVHRGGMRLRKFCKIDFVVLISGPGVRRWFAYNRKCWCSTCAECPPELSAFLNDAATIEIYTQSRFIDS